MQGFWDVFPIIIIFPTMAIIVKWILDFNMRKRLIEKGLIDGEKKPINLNFGNGYGSSSLKWGMVLVFIGGTIIIMTTMPRWVRDEVVLGAVLVAAGVALLLYYVIADILKKKQERERM
jgi:Domain of unknown function (DUF6249)